MIYELAIDFKNKYNIEFCIFLSGILARNSNNLFSDIDISYLTITKDYEEIIDLKDKMNYFLQNVLDFK